MSQHHNVSVRLNTTDYKQLEYIHNKFNSESRVKVSLADVLRIAVKELYIREFNEDSNKLQLTQTQQEQNKQVIEQLEQIQQETQEVLKEQTATTETTK